MVCYACFYLYILVLCSNFAVEKHKELNYMIREKNSLKYCRTLALVMFIFVVACRFSTSVADFYSLWLYPGVSGVLSAVSSVVPFALQDIIIVVLVLCGIKVIVSSVRQKRGVSWCVKRIGMLLLGTFVWFYMAWCNNYGRSTIFERTATEWVEYDCVAFRSFIYNYVEKVNAAWTDDVVEDTAALEDEVKKLYSLAPEMYGLAKPRSWQHPKPMMLRPFFSAVGVAGYMAPLLSESCVNSDVLPFDYPSVYAHEYAHVLGVSSEAEANWWAFQVCTSSRNRAVVYSGYKGLFVHVARNAAMFLSDDEYSEWLGTFRPEVIKDMEVTREHWTALRSESIDDIQTEIYDAFLKSNNISSGMKNYSQVVQLLMALDRPWK